MDFVGTNQPVSMPTLRLDFIEGDENQESFSQLLSSSFKVEAPGRFVDDFPVWDERLGPGRLRLVKIGVWEGKKLVACAGVRLGELHAPSGALPVALIGAVATAESHRGRGFASRVVSLAIEWARERGAALVLLWGSEVGLYERLGFELCGFQVRVPLANLPRGATPLYVGRGWVPGLMHALRSRTTGLRFVESDIRWLSAHKNVQWYWLGDPQNPDAYAAMGRGIDLKDLVHEWGGKSPVLLHQLLRKVREEHPQAALLGSPTLLGQWGFEAGTADIEFLCMAQSLDTAKVLASYGIEVPPEHVLLSKGVAVCRRLFGPGEGALSLWVWGLDAV